MRPALPSSYPETKEMKATRPTAITVSTAVNKHPATLAALVLLLAGAPPTLAYGPILNTWLEGEASFYFGDLGDPWRFAFREAAARWDDTAVDIGINLINSGTSQRCDIDGRNGVWWADEGCDGPWRNSTLAITYTWFFESDNSLVEADIVFNSTINWDIYDGRDQFLLDFRRVAAHELGHAYGAEHSEQRDSLMFEFVGDTFVPQQDDIDALSVGGDYGTQPNYTIDVVVKGGGSVDISTRVPGTVTPSGSTLQCGSSCQASYQDGLRLDVFAEAEGRQDFLRWEGISGCTTLPGCELSPVAGDRSITAIFSGTGGVNASDKTLINKIRVNWNESTAADFYEIRRKPRGGSYRLIGESDSTQYVDRKVTNMRQYIYQVRACEGSSCGDWSTGDGGKAKFNRVSGTRATDGNFSNRVTVTWNEDKRADYYQVRRSRQASGGFSTVGTAEEPRLVDRSAVPGTVYYYKVRSCSAYGCGNYSATDTGFVAE